MPLLSVKIIEGVFTPEQNPEPTDTVVPIKGGSMPPCTVVILEVEEVKSGILDCRGVSYSTAEVRALAVGNTKG